MGGGERHIEMTWRCSACGHRNLGRHMACEQCGDPKDDREEYEMPADVNAAPSVTDPELLRMARAAPNWRCAYCGSDQRALGGGCARCGAAQAEADAQAQARTRARTRAQAQARAPARARLALLSLVAFVILPGAMLAFGYARRGALRPERAETFALREPTDVPAEINGVAWTHVVYLDRWSVLDGAGFAENQPAGAFDVRAVEQRVHHIDKVPDGFNTESYSVQEPDGYDTQTYTERTSCGQDCTTRPPVCTQSCTSGKNGFASCRSVCSGGGTTCTTRYCNQTRTRQVPRTRTVTKTRQVPRFKDVPRMAAWLAWHVMGWKEVKSETLHGTTNETAWPSLLGGSADAGAGAGARAAKERERRVASYTLSLTDYAGNPRAASVSDGDLFATLTPGSFHLFRGADPMQLVE